MNAADVAGLLPLVTGTLALLALILSGAAALFVGYLLILLAAAARPHRTPTLQTRGCDNRGNEACAAEHNRGNEACAAEHPATFAVVIPAHNEEAVIGATLASLAAQEYPRDAYEVVVVADNCTDRTAAIARQAGATVLERENRTERGKGYALAYAFDHLLARPGAGADAFCIVDADTEVHPRFLAVMAARLAMLGPDAAVQGRYGVLNEGDSWRAALMGAAFDLVNHVRPLGCDRLGLSIGLKGNGMCFSRRVCERVRWSGASITEDLDYSLDLLRHGIRVRYEPHALVRAQMPVTAAQATSQRQRWERGRYRLMRERALPLMQEGLRRRSLPLFEAGFALIAPPLAELCALIALALLTSGAAFLLQPATIHLRALPLWLAGGAAVGLVAYVLLGLRVAGASRQAFLALARAPFYALWKLTLLLTGRGRPRPAGGRGDEWVRTQRIAIPAPADAAEREPTATRAAEPWEPTATRAAEPWEPTTPRAAEREPQEALRR